MQLKHAGWHVVNFDPHASLTTLDRCAIEEYPTGAGPADYALCDGGRILGVVEAKKLSLGPQNVLTQAERYSKGLIGSALNFSGYRVPFLTQPMAKSFGITMSAANLAAREPSQNSIPQTRLQSFWLAILERLSRH
jgi:type I site-specific restriction endonuclease